MSCKFIELKRSLSYITALCVCIFHLSYFHGIIKNKKKYCSTVSWVFCFLFITLNRNNALHKMMKIVVWYSSQRNYVCVYEIVNFCSHLNSCELFVNTILKHTKKLYTLKTFLNKLYLMFLNIVLYFLWHKIQL